MTDDPNYCPYHQSVNHPIEDCFPFKDWLERAIKYRVFTLSPKAMDDDKKEVHVIYLSLRHQCTCSQQSSEAEKADLYPLLEWRCYNVNSSSSSNDDEGTSRASTIWKLVSYRKPATKTFVNRVNREQGESDTRKTTTTATTSRLFKQKRKSKKKKKAPRSRVPTTKLAKAEHDKKLELLIEEHAQKGRTPVIHDEYRPKGWRVRKPDSSDEDASDTEGESDIGNPNVF